MIREKGKGNPMVGQGATIHIGSDRYPATIIAISASGKTVTLREDQFYRTDRNGISELQSYAYETNELGKEHKARLRKSGRYYTARGFLVTLGTREAYRDPTF